MANHKPTAPDAQPLFPNAAKDRQQLWWLASFLCINGTNETHRERGRRLREYLCETCEREWNDVSGWGGSPKGTHQCDWCHLVLSPAEWRDLVWGDR